VDKKVLKAEIILFSMTLIWGITFPLVKGAVATIPTFALLFIRFLISAVTLYPFIKIKTDKPTIKAGIAVGLFLFLGMATQTVGLIYTTASKSGFITGLFVVFVPFVDYLFFKTKTTFLGISGVVAATVGIYLITNPKDGGFNYGDFLTLLSAVCYAFQIVLIDKFTKKHNFESIVFYQILTTVVLSLVCSFVFNESLGFRFSSQSVIALIVTGVLATTIAFMIQGKYQQQTTALRAGIIFSFEPLSALFFSYILLSETMGATAIAGGFFIVSGIIMANYNTA
jgi:drug/metabolite transporter (DMT)-like permease